MRGQRCEARTSAGGRCRCFIDQLYVSAGTALVNGHAPGFLLCGNHWKVIHRGGYVRVTGVACRLWMDDDRVVRMEADPAKGRKLR